MQGLPSSHSLLLVQPPAGSIVVVVVVGVGRGAVVVETEPLHAMLVSSPTSAMGVLHGLWTALYSRLNDGAVPDHPRRGAGSRLAPARRRGLGSATTRSAHPFSAPVQRLLTAAPAGQENCSA